MGFVGNYAPCGLSPQIDGMPVIPKKRDRFRNPDIPSSLCTGQQYSSGNHLCRSGHIDRGCSPLRIHNLCLPETLSPDIIGVDTFFFFWPGYAFLFPSLYTLQQPGHIFSQHLHDLNAFPILQDLIRGLSMDHIPIPGRNHRHLSIEGVLVHLVKGSGSSRSSGGNYYSPRLQLKNFPVCSKPYLYSPFHEGFHLPAILSSCFLQFCVLN